MRCIYLCVQLIVLFHVSVLALSQPKNNPTDANSAEICKGACGSNTNCEADGNVAYCSCKPGFKGDPFTECVSKDKSNGNEKTSPTDSDKSKGNEKTSPTNSVAITNGNRGKTYTYYNIEKSFGEALDYCLSKGMTLAEMVSKSEYNRFQPPDRLHDYWIGGNDLGLKNYMRWISTLDPIEFNHFDDELEPEGHCLLVGGYNRFRRKRWFAMPCTEENYFACQSKV